MPSAPDGVLPISICYISAHARCSWRIKSDRFMRSTGSGFRLELRGICLLFKQWKSYANLHAFDTTNEDIAEALIWASLAAAAVKRFLAHATEHLLEVVISTHKAAMSRAYRLPELFRALCHGDGPWLRRAFEALIRYLGVNAQRAHPRRDERTGRSRLGLKPIFELTDNTELTDTYKDRKAA